MDHSPAHLVARFHEAFRLSRPGPPALPPRDIADRWQRFLEEEVGEVGEAVASGRIADVAHELADVVYVAYGTALVYGVDLDEVIAEVHRANMSKLDENGRPLLRADGKVAKSACFRPADIAAVLRRQAQRHTAP
jgi:phosphoribosyl-ATP pyrophosphohydrolase